jgi:large subunit ribosomal protein L3
MAIGLVGRKIGMTRVFQKDGTSVPVTVIHAQANKITQVKSTDTDGYNAIQVTVGEKKASRINKSQAGHFAKAGTEPGLGLWEFRLDSNSDTELNVGESIGIDRFEVGQVVDVTGMTIGKGFAGVIKRHGFGGGRATHGNSKAHRKAGSIGQNQDPGRVFPGKKMAGQMGNVKRTQQNLSIVNIDADRELIFVKGSVPGPKGQNLLIHASVKARSAVQ